MRNSSVRQTPPTTTQPANLSADWVTATPGAEGVDAAALTTGLGGAAAAHSRLPSTGTSSRPR